MEPYCFTLAAPSPGRFYFADHIAILLFVHPDLVSQDQRPTLQISDITLRTINADHPRVRGEHTHDSLRCFLQSGSSPRARGTRPVINSRLYKFRIIPACAGTHGWEVQLGKDQRIIPACAGNTLHNVVQWSVLLDHPRVRGEHFELSKWLRYGSGSSPRARGTQVE